MGTIGLFQSFGVDQDGRIVSVEEVSRGKACECCCPECGEVLIARQGEVRAWHFAHAGGADCGGGAEGALHRAAKQVLLSQSAVLVPAFEAKASHHLDDGRTGEVTLVRPPELWAFESMRDEVPVGDYRIDVVGTRDGTPVFIEIAVTHPVGEIKRSALAALGVRCFEIVLEPSLHETWTWDGLRREVLECPENRTWLCHPDLAELVDQARCEAVARAFEKPVIMSGVPERTRFRLYGTPVHLVSQAWGLCLWWPFNERVNPILKAVAKSFGGRYKGAPYRNWVLPVAVKVALVSQLEGLGAVREG